MTVIRSTENPTVALTDQPAEFYEQHTQYLKQTQLNELQDKIERLEQLAKQQKEMIDALRAEINSRLREESIDAAERELSNLEQFLANMRAEVNNLRNWAPYVADVCDVGDHLHAFQMFNDVFTQIYNRCNDIYANFGKMSVDEKFLAVAGVSMMLAGATIMVVAFTHPAAIAGGPVVGAAMATVGAYLGRQAVMAHTGEKGEKLSVTFNRLIGALCDLTKALFAAPGKAMNYAYDKYKGTKPVVEPEAEPEPEYEELKEGYNPATANRPAVGLV